MRREMIIQASTFTGTTPIQVALNDGESATIGICNCGKCAFDLPLCTTDAPWFAGRVTATSGYWLLANLSSSQALSVVNIENQYQYIIVEPGRNDAPIPFELAGINSAAGGAEPKATVFAPEPHYSPATRLQDRCVAVKPTRPTLGPNSTYFAVLRELCEPRLRGLEAVALPTSAEIAKRLRGRHARMNARAVDAHITYVADKLGLPRGCGRDSLVAVVIRSGLLNEEIGPTERRNRSCS